MGVVGNAAAPSQQSAPPRRTAALPQEKSGSVLDDGFKDIEPNTRYPKLWAPNVPEGEREGQSVEYDVRVNLIKMLAPSAEKMAEEIKNNPDDPIFIGVSHYKRETFIVEVEVVNGQSQCPAGSLRTVTTADKDYDFYGKDVKGIICAFGTLKYPNGDVSDVSDPLTVDKNDVRVVAGKHQAAIGKMFHVTVRQKLAKGTNKPFLQSQFSKCENAEANAA